MGCLCFFSAAGKVLSLSLSPPLCEVLSGNSCLIPMETPGWKRWVPTHGQARTKRVRSYRCQTPGSTGIDLAVQRVSFGLLSPQVLLL